jgi:DNA-binding transcriptional MerR regulator
MTNKSGTIVTLTELAEELGAKVVQLQYRVRTGQIPKGRQINKAYCYTPDQARRIGEWWESRKRLVFSD